MTEEGFNAEKGTRIRIPGTVSETTLKALIVNSQRIGWTSLNDPMLESLLLQTQESSLLQLPHFDKGVIHELSRSIMLLKMRKNAPTPARQIPNQGLTAYPYERNSIAIQVGNSSDPNLAPIPNEISGLTIAISLERPDFTFTIDDLYQIMQGFERNPITSVRDQIENITDNLNVLNLLFGFGKELKNKNGMYSLSPIKT